MSCSLKRSRRVKDSASLESSVHEQAGEALFERPFGDFGVVAFAAADDGGEQADGAFFQVAEDGVFDGGDGLFLDGHLAVRAVEGAEFRIEQADEVPEFGDGGDGGFAAALGNALLDGDGGREALQAVDLGFLQLLGELAGVGGHRIEEAPLALGEEDVEGEGGLAGTREAGDDDELVARDVERDVLEVMVAGAAEGDLRLEIGDAMKRVSGGLPPSPRLWRPGSPRSVQSLRADKGGGGVEFGDVLGRALGDELAAVLAGLGTEVEDPVGGFDDVEVVLDDEQRVAGIDEAAENA